MSTRIRKSPHLMRKQPVQARSKATVNAIVEAAARVLSDQGWAGFTTNKVAEAAGVSIGSYYQYFPDKNSLIDAILERHFQDCRSVMKRALAGDKPLSQFVAELIDGIIAIHSLNTGLHRVLLDEAPRSEAFRDPHSAFEKEYLGYFRAAAAKYRMGKAGAPDRIIGMIASDAVDGIVHNAARRGTLQTAEVRNELVRMVGLYLRDLSAVA